MLHVSPYPRQGDEGNGDDGAGRVDLEVPKISQSVNKQWLQFDATTKDAEELLKAEYHVPMSVQEHIDCITPGIKLYATKIMRPAPGDMEKRFWGIGHGHKPRPPPTKPMPTGLPSLGDPGLDYCNIATTPGCIMLGIFEDLGDYYDRTNLDLFFLTLAPYIPVGTHPTLDGIDGADAPTTDLADAGGKSDLDFQISYPLSHA